MKISAQFFVPVATTLLLAGCGDDHSQKAAPGTNAPAKYDTGNPLTAPVDYLGAVAQAQKFANKTIDVSYINQAIQQFNAMEGRYPKTLAELVPNYVGKLPSPPYGTKLLYDTNTWTVKVVNQ